MRYEDYLKESTLKKNSKKRAEKSALRRMLDFVASVCGGLINDVEVDHN